MKRRKFFGDLFKYSVAGSLIAITPTNKLLAFLEDSYDSYSKGGFVPYTYNYRESSFSNSLAQTRSLPKTIRNKSLEYSPGKYMWIAGEGKSTLPTKDHSLANNAPKKQGFTPVNLLKGSEHNVYGQYFKVTIGTIGLIRGFDGVFHTVYPAFISVFTSKYFCYGLPKSDYRVTSCSNCGKTYVYQDFRSDCESDTTRLYYFSEGCSQSSNGVHDNVRKKTAPPCAIPTDNLYIGDDY